MMKKLQEIMSKVPAGYRIATFEEEREILVSGMSIQTFNSKVAQHQAELEAARLKLKDALANLNISDVQRKKLLEKLGLKGEEGDILENGGRTYILVDSKKRVREFPSSVLPARKRVKKGNLSVKSEKSKEFEN